MKHVAMNVWPLVCSGLLLAGCGLERLDVAEGRAPCEVQRIFDQSCALSGCHAGAFAPDLRADAAFASVTAQAEQAAAPYVRFGDLAGSYMASKLVDPLPEGWLPRGQPSVMPLMPGAISESDRALLLGWIGGAQLESDSCATGGTDSGASSEGTSSSGSGSTGGIVPIACGIEDVDNGGTIIAVDRGDEAEKIPTDIADILEGNCGCHYTNMVQPPYVIHYAGPLDLSTLAGFSATLGAMTGATLVEQRVGTQMNMPSPAFCRTPEGDAMDPTARALLLQWIADGTPDGATWTGG
jgi:hypothetical protein